MPPRPTARCCRATLGQPHAPIEAVWVTDDVLSRAFQQYVHATGAKKRAASSAPGPLYHRQRLGRRRMTELNSFQSAGSMPVWALPNAPDMTKWQWQPPKPPSFWPQLPQVDDVAAVDAGVDLVFPEPEAEIQPLVSLETLETSGLEASSAAVEEEPMLQNLAKLSPALGFKLQALFNGTFPTALVFQEKFKKFAKSLQKEIRDGRIRGPQIFEMYDLGRRALGNESEAAQALHLAAMWAGRTDTAHLMSDDKQLVGYLAEALKTHHPRVHRSLFVIATRLTESRYKNWTRLRYNWLHILARLPNIPQSQFKHLLELFEKRGFAALSQIELGDLLLLHWESKGMVKDLRGTRRFWQKFRGTDDHKALAALALAINAKHSPEDCTAILWSFWDFIHLRVGEKTIAKQMLSLSRTQKISSDFLKRLAWTSGDYATALMLHDILIKQLGKDHNIWGPAFWEKYVTQHMKRSKHSLVSPVVLVEKLLSSPRPQKTSCHKADDALQNQTEKSALEQRQITRIKESIKMMAGAPYLTERQKFRHTAAFTKHLANVQGYLTARDLSSLTDVITEALKRGEGGSTERLRWYLGVVLDHLGEEACSQVGMILKRRRQWNRQQLADFKERTKSLKLRKKGDLQMRRLGIHDEQSSETANGQLFTETGAHPPSDSDDFGALVKGTHRQDIDPLASF
ncbi:hypothetical protein J7T55_008829 [Diaporthe amygdali]|uniref:uncharacterized protein n=1 Tax=Phomopsis amygdali TaxID=1214568 RepID=UPI0022FE7719|nr:uncharacterized protein J7T55_008829 [Diaporthe amygdali]KAJ0121662.1 hypothetical protein J7T55_008829 [Diaporthe amygdali]